MANLEEDAVADVFDEDSMGFAISDLPAVLGSSDAADR